MVVGDNPDNLIKKYDKNTKVDNYIKYRYKDAGKLKKKAVKLMQDVIDKADNGALSDAVIDYFKERVKVIKKMTDFEYYAIITDGMSINADGDAESDVNPDGKYTTCRIGRNLCIPLELKDGTTAFQAKAGEVDWKKMHMVRKELYSTAWKLYHKEIEPSTEEETKIYNNIKNQKRYFSGFKNEEEYVDYNCSYWNFAYLDENGWSDASDYKNFDWITNFYNRFVLTLKDTDLVTIYECTA